MSIKRAIRGLMDPSELTRLPRRKDDAHKGDFGRVLILAGSRDMAGAAALAALGALRSGAGLVRVASTAEGCRAVNVHAPSAMTLTLSSDNEGFIVDRTAGPLFVADLGARALFGSVQDQDSFALGPGLGTRPATLALAAGLLDAAKRKPVVIDADALELLRKQPEILSGRSLPAILTPHPGEMARICGCKDAAEVQANRETCAADFAKKHGVVLVLKGAGTVVSDGERTWTNDTGNPGMATGGAGDVLTGVIAGLLGQALSPWDAARLGVWAHGKAGDIAAAKLGETSLIAQDLAGYLGQAFLEVGS